MTEPSRSRWRRFSDGLARARQIIGNLVFLLVLIMIGWSLTVDSSGLEIPKRAALLIEPQGLIVEQRSLADPVERVLGAGDSGAELELQTIIEGLERAAEDELALNGTGWDARQPFLPPSLDASSLLLTKSTIVDRMV